MHGDLDDEMLQFIQDNSSLNSELNRSLEELLPKPDGAKRKAEEDEDNMIDDAGIEFGANAMSKWEKDLKAEEKKLASFEQMI